MAKDWNNTAESLAKGMIQQVNDDAGTVRRVTAASLQQVGKSMDIYLNARNTMRLHREENARLRADLRAPCATVNFPDPIQLPSGQGFLPPPQAVEAARRGWTNATFPPTVVGGYTFQPNRLFPTSACARPGVGSLAQPRRQRATQYHCSICGHVRSERPSEHSPTAKKYLTEEDKRLGNVNPDFCLVPISEYDSSVYAKLCVWPAWASTKVGPIVGWCQSSCLLRALSFAM